MCEDVFFKDRYSAQQNERDQRSVWPRASTVPLAIRRVIKIGSDTVTLRYSKQL